MMPLCGTIATLISCILFVIISLASVLLVKEIILNAGGHVYQTL